MEEALQKAIYDALTASPSMSVRDDIPTPADAGDKTKFPYVTVGECAVIPFDTDDSSGGDATISVNTWSRYKGRKETKNLQAEIYERLHRQELTIDGFDFIACDFLSSESFLDEDGKTRHGISRFRVLMEQQSPT